jgi:hypothetical protein
MPARSYGGARLNGGSGRPLYRRELSPCSSSSHRRGTPQLKIAEKPSAVKLIFLILLITNIYQRNPFSLNKVIA